MLEGSLAGAFDKVKAVTRLSDAEITRQALREFLPKAIQSGAVTITPFEGE